MNSLYMVLTNFAYHNNNLSQINFSMDLRVRQIEVQKSSETFGHCYYEQTNQD